MSHGEYQIRPSENGSDLTITVNGRFSPSHAMQLGLAIIARAQEAGVRFEDPSPSKAI